MNRASNTQASGPEETWDPLIFLDAKTQQKLIENRIKVNKLVEEDYGTTTQSQSLDNKQKIFLKTNCVNEANGSSYIEIGNTKILCSVYGPREIPKRDDYNFKVARLNCEFRFAAFSCFLERRGTLSQRDETLDEKNYSSIIEDAIKPSILIHKYPKSQIDVYLLCLQNDTDSRNIFAASIIAASLALANASIELYDLVAAYTYIPASVTVAYMPMLHQLSTVYFTNETHGSSLSAELFKSQIKESIENCKKVYALMKFILLSDETKTIENDEK